MLRHSGRLKRETGLSPGSGFSSHQGMPWVYNWVIVSAVCSAQKVPVRANLLVFLFREEVLGQAVEVFCAAERPGPGQARPGARGRLARGAETCCLVTSEEHVSAETIPATDGSKVVELM